MGKQSKEKQEIIFKEYSSYANIFQKRSMPFRMAETLVFIIVLFLLTTFVPTESGIYKVLVIVSTIVIIGAAPYVYKIWLAPMYVLTKKELIIQMRGEKREYSLFDVERSSDWKPQFRLNGKKETLMVSKEFLDKLDDQLDKISKVKKR